MQSVLRNSYAKDLPELSKACLPSGFKKPEIILKNYELGEELGPRCPIWTWCAHSVVLSARKFFDELARATAQPWKTPLAAHRSGRNT